MRGTLAENGSPGIGFGTCVKYWLHIIPYSERGPEGVS